MRGTSMVATLLVGLGLMGGAVLSVPALAQDYRRDYRPQAYRPHPITLRARVVDAVCLLASGLKGETHRECAIGCDRAGVRMYLLDEHENVMYSVMADGPFKDPNEPLRQYLEHVVTVRGDLYVGPGGHRVVAIKQIFLQH